MQLTEYTVLVAVFILAGGMPAAQAQPFGERQRGFDPFRGPTREVQLAPEEVEISDGAATIPDQATFDKLSYRGPEVMIDTHLADQQFVKFQVEGVGGDKPLMYFMNTKTHRAHMMFMRAIGIPRRGFGPGGGEGQMRGVLIFHPKLKTPAGDTGLYSYEFEPNDSFPFDMIQVCHGLLIEKMPLLKDRLVYYPMPAALPRYKKEQEKYETAGLPVYTDKDIDSQIGYLPLNPAQSYGRLKRIEPDERPATRDVVLVDALPNEMPRVAGIISSVRQTPLSHVNLRAVQDGVPHAFIYGASKNKHIQSLLGKYVFYRVAGEEYEIREATRDEVNAHFHDIRPKTSQIPSRDLTVTVIRSLDELTFLDARSVGTKAANVATMRKFKFPPGTIPAGAGVPFYFYDEFMKHNGFYEVAREIIDDAELKSDDAGLERALADLRARIKRGEMPDWMMTALEVVHHSFPQGTSIRCRSSTNNEDLPGFSGAGLYDSCTHHPQEGHFSKSIKQIYASLWNFRAFEEREFYRIDHLSTAMGVLVHPNYSDEIANGVAVTDDVFYQSQGNYYLNTQVGEELVTNPEEHSIPEEVLLDWSNPEQCKVLRYSNRKPDGERILTASQLGQLGKHLCRIHAGFSKHYGVDLQDPKFAMEVEYKITKHGQLVIKQARPWVFAAAPLNDQPELIGK